MESYRGWDTHEKKKAHITTENHWCGEFVQFGVCILPFFSFHLLLLLLLLFTPYKIGLHFWYFRAFFPLSHRIALVYIGGNILLRSCRVYISRAHFASPLFVCKIYIYVPVSSRRQFLSRINALAFARPCTRALPLFFHFSLSLSLSLARIHSVIAFCLILNIYLHFNSSSLSLSKYDTMENMMQSKQNIKTILKLN